MSFTKTRTLLVVALLAGLVVGFLRLGYSKHVVSTVFAGIGIVQFVTAALLSRRLIQPSSWGYSAVGSALLGLGSLSMAATAMFAEAQATIVQWLFVGVTLLLFCLGLRAERDAHAGHSNS